VTTEGVGDRRIDSPSGVVVRCGLASYHYRALLFRRAIVVHLMAGERATPHHRGFMGLAGPRDW